MGCGCGANKERQTKPQATVETKPQTEPKAPHKFGEVAQGSNEPKAQGFSDYAAKAAICSSCIHAKHDWFCRKAKRPILDTFVNPQGCPLGKHPNAEGKTKFVGLTWNGVAEPIRQIHFRKAKRLKKRAWMERAQGCGCIAWLKEKTDAMEKGGWLGRSIAQAFSFSAKKTSPLVSYLIEGFLWLWRIPNSIEAYRYPNRARPIVKNFKVQEGKKHGLDHLERISGNSKGSHEGGSESKSGC